MLDSETMFDFHAELCNISNESYVLGKICSNAKLIGLKSFTISA